MVSENVWQKCQSDPKFSDTLKKIRRTNSRSQLKPRAKSRKITQRKVPCIYLDPRVILGSVPCNCPLGKTYMYPCELYDRATIRPTQNKNIIDCSTCEAYQTLEPGGPRKWAVGITTAPVYHSDTQEIIGNRQCLNNLLKDMETAGWNDIVIFAEPKSFIPEGNYKLIQREERLGAWMNRYEGLRYLRDTKPHVDAYLMLEDDAILSKDAKIKIEMEGWPDIRCGYLSLYRPAGRTRGKGHNQFFQLTDDICFKADNRGYQKVIPNAAAWGTVGFIIPEWAIDNLLSDPLVHSLNYKSKNMSDVRLTSWVHRAGYTYWLCKPSLVDHDQTVPSAIGHGIEGIDMRADRPIQRC
jgi:hypothetical protein